MTQPTTFGEEELPEFAYNFDRWLEVKRGKVIIPEPTTTQVTTFFGEWFQASAKSTFTGEQAPEDLVDDDGNSREETEDERNDRIARNYAGAARVTLTLREKRYDLLAEVCSNEPSRETIAQLPHRVYAAFEAYVMGKLNPEA